MKSRKKFLVALSMPLAASIVSHIAHADEPTATTTQPSVDAVVVWGEQKESEQAGYTSPVSTLTQQDMTSINMATTEDAVKYEPSIVIRRRFIGDSNGTLGMRGSNMFQTSRSMVFADGVPLHYLLQSRWNGSPRWTMVSSSEIARVDVLYGPFSAEYSGNAMGGVINIETRIPQKREFHADGMGFGQQFKAYGFDDKLYGYKGFMSYGDKIGGLSMYMSYNRLQNRAQPQSYYYNSISTDSTATAASGGILANDAKGVEKMVFGDSGAVDTTTNNYKIKAGYTYGKWSSLLNLAYEDRASANTGNSYVIDANGNSVYSGDVTQDGQTYNIKASSIASSELTRDSLNAGLRIKGELSDTARVELNTSSFNVLKDETRASSMNPNATAFTGAGLITDYSDTGWQTADAKLTLDDVFVDGLSLVGGARYEAYDLNIDVYNTDDYDSGAKNKDNLKDSSGGQTDLSAVFGQVNWDINELFDTSIGGRFEYWRSMNGYYANDNPATTQLDLSHTPNRSAYRFSPKLSVGVKPGNWVMRYSLAKAYRFPIVEELYSQYEAYSAKSEANPGLKPEDGLHHNLMIEHGLNKGYVRLNVFQETIKDVIESQAKILDGGGSLRTFIPIDEVQTYGTEFIVNANSFMLDALDVRFNVAYTHSKIVKNSADTGYEGKFYPRMPQWRSNLLATYHITPAWNFSGNMQYASDSFGNLDNSDTENNVYGAQDAYTRFGLKTAYQINRHFNVDLGVDNITNEIAYVAHPYPGRTVYLKASYDL